MNYDELDPDDLPQLHVCHECVGEPYVKGLILDEGNVQPCDFCDNVVASINLEELSEHVDLAIASHFVRTAAEPDGYEYAMMRDPEMDYEWEREGVEIPYVIEEEAMVSDEIAEGIRRILSDKHDDWDEIQAGGWENPFDEEARYESADVETYEMQSLWNDFTKSLRQRARFLNTGGMAILDSVFEDLATWRSGSSGKAVITLRPNERESSLFRARRFDSSEEILEALKRPSWAIGSPPHEFASAGRMNAKGISVFYGALSRVAALAEVRPPVGSFVVTAKFDLLRDFKLLDLRNLRDIEIKGSVFDPAFLKQLEKAKFLRHLSDSMSAAVLPRVEDFEYLVTQVVAEYLSAKHGLDGMVYPSPQSRGETGENTNIVLFHPSAKVKETALAPGAKLETSSGWMTDEGYEVDFSIVETVSDQVRRKEDEDDIFSTMNGDGEPWTDDFRPDSLELDLRSLKVHEVNRVEIKTDDHEVRFSSLVAK